MTSAAVTGIDISERFIEFARDAPAPKRGAVAWKVGSAESLPVDQGSFDRAVLPLCCTSLQIPSLPSRRHSVRLPLMGVWSFGRSPRLMSPRACRIGSSP